MLTHSTPFAPFGIQKKGCVAAWHLAVQSHDYETSRKHLRQAVPLDVTYIDLKAAECPWHLCSYNLLSTTRDFFFYKETIVAKGILML